MKLIINADDFGANHNVNTEITNCINDGLITSASIMANGSEYNEAVSIANKNSNISFGVHLSIDEYKSLTQSSEFLKYGIIDNDGFFIKNRIFQINKFSDELKQAIYKELIAQIYYVKKDIGLISHIDSHHHFHTIPLIKDVISEVINTTGLSKVRQNSYKPIMLKMKENMTSINNIDNQLFSKQKKIGVLKKIVDYLKYKQWHCYFSREYNTTDFFCSISYFLENYSYIVRMFDSVEIMTHPGHPNYQCEIKYRRDLFKSIDESIYLVNYWNL